ncbi:hypothetical protein sos41_02820 [Alphaproteobacteria bacterium SO-S41]|nr:hypothetical protein sos41_02820 [Alphaproteobacteria bacterium SO-S41]
MLTKSETWLKMSKASDRRDQQRTDLIAAAERTIAASGLAGLKTRDLARAIGVANGAVYNLVADLDELILHVSSRTLRRLGAAVATADNDQANPPLDRLTRIALAYSDFATGNLELWRSLFEHRMAPGKTAPDWARNEQLDVFRYILQPLRALLPAASETDLGLAARSLFSAIHGIVALGLDQQLVGVPQDLLDAQIPIMVRAMVTGLVEAGAPTPPE